MKPIEKPIDQSQATAIISTFSERASQASKKSEGWIYSFLQGLNISPKDLHRDSIDPTLFHIEFQQNEEAALAARWIEYAAHNSIFEEARRPIVMKCDGSQLTLALVSVVIPSSDTNKDLFTYFRKEDEAALLNQEFASYIGTRYLSLIGSIDKGSFISEEATSLSQAILSKTALSAAQRKNAIDPLVKALSPYVTELNNPLGKDLLGRVLISSLYNISQKIKRGVDLQQKSSTEYSLSSIHKKLILLLQERIHDIELPQEKNREKAEERALQNLKIALQAYGALAPLQTVDAQLLQIQATPKDLSWFERSLQSLQKKRSGKGIDLQDQSIYADLSIGNPFFSRVLLDISSNRIELISDRSVQAILQSESTSSPLMRQFIQEELLQQAAVIARTNGEEIHASSEGVYSIPFFSLPDATSFIKFSPAKFSPLFSSSILYQIGQFWNPRSADLDHAGYQHFNAGSFQALQSSEEKRIGLVAFSPSLAAIPEFDRLLKPTSFYIIARGAQAIIEAAPTKEARAQVMQELQNLSELLQKHGFISYSGQEIEKLTGSKEFHLDLIFELEGFYLPYLSLTQEKFIEKGSFPVLEFTTLENRLRVENQIDDAEQEALIRSKEMWQSAQVSLNPQEKIIAPKPSENVLFANLKKNIRKYFRGDYSRVLHWGLDLSGGKSIKIGLYDTSMRPITGQKELQRATSELYERLNGMGVSERVIRVENDTISIDFPGSQEISSAELIQASALSFHIANEKFGSRSKRLSIPANEFLQEVWNEACLTNRKNLDDINDIASRRLKEARIGREGVSENTKLLVEEGLDIRTLQDPDVPPASSAFDDALSMIVWYKNERQNGRSSQISHPLLIVFRNYALEGANLSNVHPSFDPTRGNILSFQVKAKDETDTSKIGPQDSLYNWTSRFCPEAIQKTELQDYSQGRGWHMAVVLNGTVISAPDLSVAIRDSACISGTFSQREVQRLARDIQAGSLSYIPKVLSEYNVSPELGEIEWQKGVFGSSLAILSVIVIMILYYRFAGVVASVAVAVNILIIWAIMQNIDAAMTLPSLAGIVLTVGMAIDANVLVFERIREELQRGVQLSLAVKNGYQRAFSAIIDSNLTTLIAAFILTRFDSGPVRGFAVTLIIGVISSMCTSLFMTKVYFSRWLQSNPEKKTLTMASWFPPSPKYLFSRYTRPVVLFSGAILLFGAFALAVQYRTIFGMDFTGGYALIAEIEDGQNRDKSPKEMASSAFEKAGLQLGEYQIRELGSQNLLRIQLSSSLDQPGKPFFKIQEQKGLSQEKNPRITWIVERLKNGGVFLSESELERLPNQWSVISGQFSATMRNNAIYALSLSLLAILIYIAIRFEWKYAISSVLALLHDVLMTVASLGILSWFGLNIQLNLEVIGALMTIIGYSLNDTIIVFDRVREEQAIHRKKGFQAIVDLSLNSTLSRTIMTSSTTLAVLLMLVIFGGHSIFTFSLVMFIGIFLGTISSLFVAAPLLVYFDKHEEIE